ncbi:Rha family transcriptional regulator [Clostridium botulinum]|uniref:Rha family transcriptional regulator n=1 Tax=Clostridium botulinum TaxID=1491 RepID=UPI000773A94A|nr:Rha family transcriptional regulator [Clostridium botulinum]
MKALTILNKGGQLVSDSREVAQTVEKRHCNLVRDIETYIQYLENSRMSSQDFFIKDSYKTDGNNKTYKCYLLTKQGCEMVANKMTGEKGVLFTAKYVQAFNKMENYINNNKVVNSIKAEVTTLIDDIVTQKISEIEEKCSGYYRPSSFEKYNISQYIKKRLGISKADEEYELVKQRVLIKLNATKWEDISIEVLRDSLNIIDESIRVIKSDRNINQVSIFD